MFDLNTIQHSIAQSTEAQMTDRGVRIRTHCLYPSFDPVDVFVVGYAEGAIVHDDGGAAKSSWVHGVSAAKLKPSAQLFGCETKDGQISQKISSLDWLWAAIAAVANASAHAAQLAVGKSAMTKEDVLITKTKTILDQTAKKDTIKRRLSLPGESGKIHEFELSVRTSTSLVLIDSVSPHHVSIAAKYMAFSDVKARPGLYKYAVYETDLPQEDKTLLSTVADLIPFHKISETGGKQILQHHAMVS